MATRSMFLRILWKLLGASRGRLALALVALSSGAAVSSALLNVNLDAERKLTQEFRTLGANVVVAPPSGGSDAALADAGIMERIAGLQVPQIVAAAPYLYVAANSGTQPVILAGTWFDQVAKMNSWWKLDGNWVASRGTHLQCLVGSAAARQLGLKLGSPVELRSGEHSASLTVAGIVTTGGSEDSQIITDLGVAQNLAGLIRPREPGAIERFGNARRNRVCNQTPRKCFAGSRCPACAPDRRRGGKNSRSNSRTDFLDDRADSCALHAGSACINGRSGHGAQP